MKDSKFKIYIEGNIFSNSQNAFTLENAKKLGEKKDNQIVYSPFEALYLLENNNAQIIKNNKPISKEQSIKILSKKDKSFLAKYLVFRELRKKGYIVKTGLKFGGEFRVYCNSKKSRDFSACHPHAKYICHVINSEKLEIKDLVAKTRISHSTGKKLLLAIVDNEDDVSFYEIDWVKL